MAKRSMLVLDHSGHSKIAEWDTETLTQSKIDALEAEYNEKVKKGFFAADITDKRDVLIQRFDPNADILFIPRVQGGR